MLASRFSHLAVWRSALRVLCYHRVVPDAASPMAVTPEQLDAQLDYLSRSGFTFIHARDLLSNDPLPARPLLLTFDDGYVDNLEHAQPVLQRRGAKATIFLATGYAGDRARWDADGAPLMSVAQLRSLDADRVELALHSHAHRSFAGMPLPDIEADLQSNLAFFRENALPVTPVLAYPYGARPKRKMIHLAELLASLGIKLAFRLGNRVNRLPLADPYEIQRIDVSGIAGGTVFRRKLWIGRLL